MSCFSVLTSGDLAVVEKLIEVQEEDQRDGKAAPHLLDKESAAGCLEVEDIMSRLFDKHCCDTYHSLLTFSSPIPGFLSIQLSNQRPCQRISPLTFFPCLMEI